VKLKAAGAVAVCLFALRPFAIGVSGKHDVHQKTADAQVRLQRSGYHSTHIDGDTPYHTVAVEQSGDFVWIDGGVDNGRVYQNPGDMEAWFHAIIFPRVP